MPALVLSTEIWQIKIQDTYYLETSLNGTGSVIIIANDQLSDMHTGGAYLLSFLPEIVSAAVR